MTTRVIGDDYQKQGTINIKQSKLENRFNPASPGKLITVALTFVIFQTGLGL